MGKLTEKQLTEKTIRDARSGLHWDRQVPGLGLRVYPSGVRKYVLRYRTAGKQRMIQIGIPEEMSLKVARIDAGRRLDRIREEGEPEPEPASTTVADGVEEFFSEWCPERIKIGRLAKRTMIEYRKQARRYILPAMGKVPIAEAGRQDVVRMLRPLADRPVQRNRVQALASRLFTLFEVWEYRTGPNPCKGIDKAIEEPRDRVLTSEEVTRLAAALDEAAAKYRPVVEAIRVALFSGLRISEVRLLRWEDVNFETNRVRLRDTKTGTRIHIMPPPAIEVIERQIRLNEWILTSGRPAPLMYRTIRHRFAEIAKAAGLENVRLHDLRRTFMTWAAESGANTYQLRQLLGHKTTQMADRYVRAVETRDLGETVSEIILTATKARVRKRLVE